MTAGCAARPARTPDPATLIKPSSRTIPQTLPQNRRTVVRFAIDSIGKPYKWGGTSPGTGFDCSGLVFYTHGRAGITPLPRTASSQYHQGRNIPRSALQPGDLVFFRTLSKKGAFHVGIYIGDQIFVHAPGRGRRVRAASLSNPYFQNLFIGARTFL